MRRIRVNVTERDIRLGEPGAPMECPIARAIQRHLSPDVFVLVEGNGDSLNPTGAEFIARLADGAVEPVSFRVRLPDMADEWMRAFDGGNPVEPFQFTVEVPEEVLRNA